MSDAVDELPHDGIAYSKSLISYMRKLWVCSYELSYICRCEIISPVWYRLCAYDS